MAFIDKLIGKAKFIKQEQGFALSIQKGLSGGNTVFLAIIDGNGMTKTGKFLGTFAKSKAEGLTLLQEVIDEGKNGFKEN